MADDYVSLKELALEMGMDRSHARRYILRNGFLPHSRRTPGSKNQRTLALTVEDADRIRALRREEGFSGSTKVVSRDVGWFYVVRLVPEFDPRRIKLGFAEDVGARLTQHRTAAPTATLVEALPCKRSWESTVIDCLTADDCRLVLNEVYECSDVDALQAKMIRLFEMLPDLSRPLSLSDHSPLNT